MMFATLPKKKKKTGPRTLSKNEKEAARSRVNSAIYREIGPLPGVVDPARRDACRTDLRLFCLTYFPHAFPLPFCRDHLRMIEKLERAILHGGLFALAMPRGSGKSTLTLAAAAWALVYGHRRFVVLIGATTGKAKALLANLKAALRTNDLLAADFPEACYPIRCLEDDGRRANGQILNGTKTHITWGKEMLVFPTVPGSVSSGAVISVAGLTAAMRGANHTLESGEVLRPDLVIPDDPQTRESAWSDGQCESRFQILAGDVLGMAGPGRKIAAVMLCTVIRKGDLADRILDRKKCPEWQGERTKMVYKFPLNEKLWEQYAQLRSDSLQADGDGSEATEFYREHRAEMDAGSEVAWPERFDPDEISALQSAMNLKFRDEDAFAAEAQNEPREAKVESVQLTAAEICQKLNGFARGAMPAAAQKVTAFIDVQDAVLFYAVCAWGIDDFDGWVIDYGTYPEQSRRYFSLRQATPTLATTFPGLTTEAAIRKGLEKLTEELNATEYRREDGAVMPIDKLLIDQGYLPPVIHAFIRASGQSSQIMPAKGVGIGAAGRPMNEYIRKPGETIGSNWMIPQATNSEIRHVRSDVNYWKTFIHKRLALPNGTKGALTLYGSKSNEHRLLAEHVTAESGIPTEGHGRQLIEWRKRPSNPDNHFLDCLVGCAVAASMLGCGKSIAAPGSRPQRRRRGAGCYYATVE
jgi:hypothetical protein